VNDALKQQLLTMLQGLAEAAKTGTSWVTGQIPPLVYEKIAFGRAWESVLFLLFVSAAIALYTLSTKTWGIVWNYTPKRYSDDAVGWGFAAFFCSAGFILCTIAAMIQLREVVLVWFAPRLYIVEWLLSLVKAGGQ
jgi:hypothetical protein